MSGEVKQKPLNGELLLDQQISKFDSMAKELQALRDVYRSLPQPAQDAIVQLIYRGMR